MASFMNGVDPNPPGQSNQSPLDIDQSAASTPLRSVGNEEYHRRKEDHKVEDTKTKAKIGPAINEANEDIEGGIMNGEIEMNNDEGVERLDDEK